MLRKPNLHGIPREIRDVLRQLQDACSEELDIDSSETSSQGSIEPDNPEDTDFGKGGWKSMAIREEPVATRRGRTIKSIKSIGRRVICAIQKIKTTWRKRGSGILTPNVTSSRY